MKKKSAVGILITEQGILMLKRHPYDRTLPNFLCLPGGKLDENETSEEGLLREFLEETCLSVNKYNFINSKENEKFHIDFYKVEVDDLTKLQLSDEHETHQYILLEDLINYKSLIAPKTFELLSEYAATVHY